VGPVPFHSSQGGEAAAKQLFGHINCFRACPAFDPGPRSQIPADILAQFESEGLEGKISCVVHDAKGFAQHFAAELRQEWMRSTSSTCTHSGCAKVGASIGCAVKGCSCRVHLRCALAEDGLLVAVPVLMVLRTMRPIWLWLCSDHKYGADPAAWEEELPKPLPGNVCVNVEDLPDKLCESLAMLGVLLPLGVLPSSEEDGDSSCTKVVFSDTYFYTTVRTVQDDSLLLPLTLPECERDEASDSEDDLPVTALAAHSASEQQKQQQQQQPQQQPQQQQQQQQRQQHQQLQQQPRSGPVARVNECGHLERRHKAHGLCLECYKQWRKGGCKSLPGFIDTIKAAAAAAIAAADDDTTATAAATGGKVNPKITACPHIAAAHKALGMCRPCYQQDMNARRKAKQQKPEQHAAATGADDATSKKRSAFDDKGSVSGTRGVADRVQLSSSASSSDEDEPIARMQGARKHASGSNGASAAKRQKLSAPSTAADAVLVVDGSDEEHSGATDSSMHASAKLATVCACGMKDVYKNNRCYRCYKHYKAAKRSTGTTEQQQQQQLDSASDSAVQTDRYSAATATSTTVQQRTRTGEHKRRSVYSSDARSVQVERYSSANRFAAVTHLPASSASSQQSSSNSSGSCSSGSNFSAVTAAMTDAANAQFPSAASIAAGLPASSLQRTRHDLAQKYTHDWQLELVHNSRLRAAVNAINAPSRVQFSSSLCTVYKYVHNDLGVDEYAAANNSSEQCDDDADDDDVTTGTALQQLESKLNNGTLCTPVRRLQK
jgi:hypothetical protein